ncbi:MAG: CopG family transcriptional regulator [Burkholderiales bacterium]
MRTTLDLDEDVLASAKEIARRENKTAGQVLSELARRALTQGAGSGAVSGSARAAKAEPASLLGFRPFASRGAVVTNALVQKLRDEGEY